MHNHFDRYRSLFPGRRNEDAGKILASVRFLHDAIAKKVHGDSPTIGGGSTVPSFSERIPDVGKESTRVLEELAPAFEGMMLWNHPQTLHNITPPSLADGIAARTVANLFNPNCLWDHVSGNFIHLERSVVRQVAELAGFPSGSRGVFTFGGKGTLMYAVKLGINRCDPWSRCQGVRGDCVVITSESNHYAIEYVCNLVGLGQDACVRIPTDDEGLIDVRRFRETLRALVGQGKKIACVILSGGNSLNNTIDPVAEVAACINECCAEHDLGYRPLLHVDSVIGWLWLMFNGYDFAKNELGVEQDALRRIDKEHQRITEIRHADSIGVDFHKNAFAPYISSLYLCRRENELLSMNVDGAAGTGAHERGDNFLQHFTLEHSRSGGGIVSAYVSLQEIGQDGFRRYIAAMMEARSYIEGHLDAASFEVLNPDGLGFPAIVLPLRQSAESLERLKGRPRDEILAAGRYCHALFRHLSACGEPDVPTVGFVPNYSRSVDGTSIPAFKLYPMSVETNESELAKCLSALCAAKKAFDAGRTREATLAPAYQGAGLHPQ